MKFLSKQLQGIENLVFPSFCLACNEVLSRQAEHVCLACESTLPQTQFHTYVDNPFVERFWGRLPLTASAAMFHFQKGNGVQKLIFQLKYHGKSELGVFLGRWYGTLLARQADYNGIDWIIPVPLHPKKKRIRGYNQSSVFAKGLSETLNIPWRDDWLLREVHTETQTKKSVFDRVANMESVFSLSANHELRNKRVLLVDDVLTTGATLEACARVLIRECSPSIQMATIAIADG